jgi:TonB family protein
VTVLVGIGVSALLHVLLVWLAPRGEPAERGERPRDRTTPVEVRREIVKLAEERVKADLPRPKPEVPPPRRLEVPKPRKPDVPKPAPSPAPLPAPSPEPVKPSAPKPFVLKDVALNGGVKVDAGDESRLFGNPAVRPEDAPKGSDGPPGPAVAESGNAVEAPRRVVVVPPQVLRDAKGRYPPEHRGLERVVRVELMLSIDASGDVAEVRVTKGDLPAFDAEALATARRLRFKPATRDGSPIPYPLKWTVVFLPEGG